jgi:soluble lytic murein transglycosylase-like protein
MKVVQRIVISSVFSATMLFSCPVAGWCDIYKYVDTNGVVHFTNTPTGNKFRFYLKESPKPDAGSGTLSDQIARSAKAFDLDEALIKAVIKVESNYDPKAVSARGAQGMMQLIPATAREMQVNDPFNAADNIRGGSRYLRQMLDQFGGNLELALAAYNAGPGNVRRYGGVPPFAETQNYIQQVKKYLQFYR